jgi:hypothetical protein
MAITDENELPRPQSDALRLRLFLLPGLASAYTFAILFGLSSWTGSLFAWRMSPLSAATIGACYGGSCLMDILAARASEWVSVRSAVVPVVLLLALTVAADVSEPAQLHLGGGAVFPFASAWIWLGLNNFLALGALVGVVVQVFQVGETRRVTQMPAAPTGFLLALALALGRHRDRASREAALRGVVAVAARPARGDAPRCLARRAGGRNHRLGVGGRPLADRSGGRIAGRRGSARSHRAGALPRRVALVRARSLGLSRRAVTDSSRRCRWPRTRRAAAVPSDLISMLSDLRADFRKRQCQEYCSAGGT